jgi:hypothetical protein
MEEFIYLYILLSFLVYFYSTIGAWCMPKQISIRRNKDFQLLEAFKGRYMIHFFEAALKGQFLL